MVDEYIKIVVYLMAVVLATFAILSASPHLAGIATILNAVVGIFISVRRVKNDN